MDGGALAAGQRASGDERLHATLQGAELADYAAGDQGRIARVVAAGREAAGRDTGGEIPGPLPAGAYWCH